MKSNQKLKPDQIENKKFTCSFAGKAVMTANVAQSRTFLLYA